MINTNELLPHGFMLGGFKIIEKIGHGKLGIVYRATQVNLNRDVAIKVIFDNISKNETFIKSLFLKVQELAALNNQGIIRVYDAGQAQGHYYYAMELIDGGHLQQKLSSEGPLNIKRALRYMTSVSDSLNQALTLNGATHGEIKPKNFMVTAEGGIKLANFGLSHAGGPTNELSLSSALYTAPEKICRTWENNDPRADMYSLGVSLYELIAGFTPFLSDDLHKVLDMQLNSFPPSLHRVCDAPQTVSQFVERLLSKNPDERFSDWNAVKEKINQLLPQLNKKSSTTTLGKNVVKKTKSSVPKKNKSKNIALMMNKAKSDLQRKKKKKTTLKINFK